VALVAPRRPHRTGHRVARPQLAAADLRRRDIHVVARLAGGVGVHPHEAAPVWQHVEHAGGGLLLGERLFLDLRLLLDRVGLFFFLLLFRFVLGGGRLGLGGRLIAQLPR